MLKDKVKEQKQLIQDYQQERSDILKKNAQLVDQLQSAQDEALQVRIGQQT